MAGQVLPLTFQELAQHTLVAAAETLALPLAQPGKEAQVVAGLVAPLEEARAQQTQAAAVVAELITAPYLFPVAVAAQASSSFATLIPLLFQQLPRVHRL